MKMPFYATMIVGISLFHTPILAGGNADPSDEPQYQGEMPTGQAGAGQGIPGMKMKSNRTGNQKGIIIETGIVVQGGKTASGAPGVNASSPANKNGIIVIGGKSPAGDPASLGTSTTAIGPKQDEPHNPPSPDANAFNTESGANSTPVSVKKGIVVQGGKNPGGDPAALGSSTTSIGPKQDEPTPPPPSELGSSSRILPGQ